MLSLPEGKFPILDRDKDKMRWIVDNRKDWENYDLQTVTANEVNENSFLKIPTRDLQSSVVCWLILYQ